MVPGGGINSGIPVPAGIDGSAIEVTISPDGSRKRIHCPNAKPRINSYGNSFTHCDQVNDGETWQEYLAGHLQEPIGNYGRGGGSVYESYRRMMSVESTSSGADYLILYIWGDDHLRTLAARSFLIFAFEMRVGSLSMSNPYVYFDLEREQFAEGAGLLSSRASLDHLKDRRWLRQVCRDDLAHQLILFGGYGPKGTRAGTIGSVDMRAGQRLAECLNVSVDLTKPEDARHLLEVYGLEASKFILGKARNFAHGKGKKLLVVLFDPYRSVQELIETGKRWDGTIVDYLKDNDFTFFDMTQVQFQDFLNQKSSFEEYRKKYFVNGFGHYNAFGNSIFAYSLKSKLVDWLDPKPRPYAEAGPENIDNYIFNGILGKEN